MIAEVEQVHETPVSSFQTFPFPAIDFKFVNRGSAVAVIKALGVDLCAAQVDITPVLEFVAFESGGGLQITAEDQGWGPQCRFDVTLAEPVLDVVFPRSSLRFNGTVASGEESPGCQFALSAPFDDSIKRAVRRLISEWKSLPADRLYTLHSVDDLQDLSRGLLIGRISLIGDCWDANRQKDAVQAEARRGYGKIFLSEDGFTSIYRGSPSGGGLDSDAAFCVIVDPSLGTTEKRYAMSRQISPAGAERFHVIVGATKSSELVLRFKFYTDGDNEVCSDRFTIRVWRPRNLYVPDAVDDGAEFRNKGGRWVLSNRSSFHGLDAPTPQHGSVSLLSRSYNMSKSKGLRTGTAQGVKRNNDV